MKTTLSHKASKVEPEALRLILGQYGVNRIHDLAPVDRPVVEEAIDLWIAGHPDAQGEDPVGALPDSKPNPELSGYRVGTPHPTGLTPEDEDLIVLEGYNSAKANYAAGTDNVNPYNPTDPQGKLWDRGVSNYVNSLSRQGANGPDRDKDPEVPKKVDDVKPAKKLPKGHK